MRFKKGEIVPYCIIPRSKNDYNDVIFGTDVEVIDGVIRPMKELNKGESVIMFNKPLNVYISSSYVINSMPNIRSK